MRFAFQMQRRIDVQSVNCVQNVSNVPVGTLGAVQGGSGVWNRPSVPVGTLARAGGEELIVPLGVGSVALSVPTGTLRLMFQPEHSF